MIRRLVVRIGVALVVMAGLSLYAGYLLTGQLPGVLAGLLMRDSGGTAVRASEWHDIGLLQGARVTETGGHTVIESGGITIFKWQDQEGRWHYASEAPARVAARRIEIPAGGDPNPSEAAAAPASTAAAQGPAPANPYSADGIRQIMQRAEQARQLMEQRSAQQQEVMSTL